MRMKKCGGALGPQAYDTDDFDLLAACTLDENQLHGVFLIPMSLLEEHGITGVKATDMRLYTPWQLPRKDCAKLEQTWQLGFFLDLRSWRGSGKLAAKLSQQLDELIMQAVASAAARVPKL